PYQPARRGHPGRKAAALPDVSANTREPGGFYLGTDVVDHRRRNALGCRRRQQLDHDSAERGTEHDGAIDVLLVEQRGDVSDVLLRHVARRIARVVALSAAAQVDCDDSPLARERGGNRLEIAAIARESGNAEDRGTVGAARVIAVAQRQTVVAGPLALAPRGRGFWHGSACSPARAPPLMQRCARNRKPPPIGPTRRSSRWPNGLATRSSRRTFR